MSYYRVIEREFRTSRESLGSFAILLPRLDLTEILKFKIQILKRPNKIEKSWACHLQDFFSDGFENSG